MATEIEKIKNLGKDSIITLATTYITANYDSLQVNFKDYDISVWSNRQRVIVKLKRLVPYTPFRFKGTEPPFYRSSISFDLTVEIISPTKCRISAWGLEDFFVPTQEDLANLAFVEEHFGLHQKWFETSVVEEENHFSIEVDNDVSFGRYFIDKGTGKQTIPPIQGSYEPNPFPDFGQEENPDRMVEIKD